MGIALAIGSSTVSFAERMIEIAIPQIMVAMGVSLDKVQWVRTGPAIVRTILGPMVGWLVGIFSLVQLFSSPIIGKLSDRFGRKVATRPTGGRSRTTPAP